MKRRCSLYRFYDENGLLLYVGISLNAVSRLSYHRRDAPWYDQIRRIEIQPFKSVKGARYAESMAIHREHPIYNIARRQRYESFADIPLQGFDREAVHTMEQISRTLGVSMDWLLKQFDLCQPHVTKLDLVDGAWNVGFTWGQLQEWMVSAAEIDTYGIAEPA